jgi:DNA polymerase-1
LIALDTEYSGRIPKAFIATICGPSRKPYLFDLRDPSDFKRFKFQLQNTETLIFHQAAADIYALYNAGIDLRYSHKIIDTMVIAQLVNENYESRALKKLAQIYLKEPCEEEKELKKVIQKYKRECKKKQIPFSYDLIPADVLFPYAKQDALYTWDLYHFFQTNKNINLQSKLFRLEMKLVPIIVNMTRRGVLIDRSYCQREIKRLKKISNEAYNKIISLSGRFLNPGSPKQVRDFVNEHLPELLNKRDLLTEKGGFSTNKEAMKILKNEHPVFEQIEKYRRAEKMISTYYQPLLTEYTTEDDPVAHFSFYQSGAKTGRFSAELIQTIPKERESKEDDINALRVRHAFQVRTGYRNFYFDYDQIEMRIFAHFSKNKALIDGINNGLDPHQATANDLFDTQNATKDQRRIAKTINFGLIYGMGLNALIQKLNLGEKEGREILNRYNKKYRIKEYIYEITRELYKKGFLFVDWIGRYYYLPKDLAYKGVNTIIQGSAAYVMKLGMLSVKEVLMKKYPDVNMLLTIHDELVFEIPYYHSKRYMNNFVKDIKSALETNTLFAVPITAAVEYSETNWGEKQKWDK